jgi:hypothetical protein
MLISGRDGAIGDVADAGCKQKRAITESERHYALVWNQTAADFRKCSRQFGEYWRVEPDVGRVAHGVPARVDRLKGLGNAIVPQIAEWIGRQILAAEGLTRCR